MEVLNVKLNIVDRFGKENKFQMVLEYRGN